MVAGSQDIWILSLALHEVQNQVVDRYIFFTTVRNLKRIGLDRLNFPSNLGQQVNNFQIEISHKDYSK